MYGYVAIQSVCSLNIMGFHWDPLPNISTVDANYLCVIFKVMLGNQCGFYWQLFSVGYAQLKQLHAKRSYVVEVRFGPANYANENMWPILQQFTTYTIRTNDFGNFGFQNI